MTTALRDGWRRLRSLGLRDWLLLERRTMLQIAKTAAGLRASWDHDKAMDWLRRARDVDASRADAADAVRKGDESLRYNPLARDEAENVARLTEASIGLEHGATQLRGITRALADLGPDRDGRQDAVLAELADVLEQAGTAAAAYGRAQVDTDAQSDLARAHRAAEASLARVSAELTGLPSGNDPRTLVSIYVDAGRMLHEIGPDGAHSGALPAQRDEQSRRDEQDRRDEQARRDEQDQRG